LITGNEYDGADVISGFIKKGFFVRVHILFAVAIVLINMSVMPMELERRNEPGAGGAKKDILKDYKNHNKEVPERILATLRGNDLRKAREHNRLCMMNISYCSDPNLLVPKTKNAAEDPNKKIVE